MCRKIPKLKSRRILSIGKWFCNGNFAPLSSPLTLFVFSFDKEFVLSLLLTLLSFVSIVSAKIEAAVLLIVDKVVSSIFNAIIFFVSGIISLLKLNLKKLKII